jgi:hypothetical protein
MDGRRLKPTARAEATFGIRPSRQSGPIPTIETLAEH